MFDNTLTLVDGTSGNPEDADFVLISDAPGITIRKNSSRTAATPESLSISHRTNSKTKTSVIQVSVNSTSLSNDTPPVSSDARVSVQFTLPSAPNETCIQDARSMLLAILDFFVPVASYSSATATRAQQLSDADASISDILGRLMLGEG